MTDIAGGPAIYEKKKFWYEEVDYKVHARYNIGCPNQNEGNLYIYKLDKKEYAVNRELEEVYAYVVKCMNDKCNHGIKDDHYILESLTSEDEELLTKHNIKFNQRYFFVENNLIEKCKKESIDKYKQMCPLGICQIVSNIGIGNSVYLKLYSWTHTGNQRNWYECYTKDKHVSYICDNLENAIPLEMLSYIESKYFCRREYWKKYPQFVSQCLYTSKFEDKNGERYRKLFDYVIDRDTNKILGILDGGGNLHKLIEGDIKFFKELNNSLCVV